MESQNIELDKLIQQVQKGDVQAFRQVVEKYERLAYSIAMKITKNQEEAEEVVQDSFLKIYRYIHQYNGESKFSSWLYKIVYNTSLTKIRNKKLAIEPIGQSHLNLKNIEDRDAIVKSDQEVIIKMAIEQLATDDQLILTLFYLAEKNINEISVITDWSKSNCKVKLMRARNKLAEVFKSMNLKMEDLI